MKTKLIFAALVLVCISCKKPEVKPQPTIEEINAQYLNKFGKASFWSKRGFAHSIHIGMLRDGREKIEGLGGKHIIYSDTVGRECGAASQANYDMLVTGMYSYTATTTRISDDFKLVLDSVISTGHFEVTENGCTVVEVK